jgi:hypothetical protein
LDVNRQDVIISPSNIRKSRSPLSKQHLLEKIASLYKLSSPEFAVDLKFNPKETEAPTTLPKLKIDQKILINWPFWLSVGYESIRDPWAVQRRPAEMPRRAPAAMTKPPAFGWMFIALNVWVRNE